MDFHDEVPWHSRPGHCPGHLAGRTDSPGPELMDNEPAPEGEQWSGHQPITGHQAVAAAHTLHPTEPFPFPPPLPVPCSSVKTLT